MDDIERSPSGSTVYRHKANRREWQPPENSGVHLQAIEKHLEEHVGTVETVYHENNLVPLYQEEMDLKLTKGADALETLFDKNGIGVVVDTTRKNVAKRIWSRW